MQSFGNKDNPCKSFAPNIFNKNKCQNCFRPRETHLKSDKDLNKAKPVYGGWLLLAPIGTDFSNLMHKNRKWQRRWFVLFEHGALRYALDDNMSTVAQGTLDMNKCTDVIYADSITDQKHSLCITLPDLRYFIRGESKEDIMGWHDQLVIYPDTIKEEKMMKKRFFKRKSEGPAKPQLELVTATSFSAPNTPLSKTKQTHINNPSQLTKLQSPDEVKPYLPGSPRLHRTRNDSSSSANSGIKSPISDRMSGFGSPPPTRAYNYRKDPEKLKISAKDLRSGSRNNEPYQSEHTNSESSLHSVRNDSATNVTSTDNASLLSTKLQRNISVSTSSLDSSTSSHSLADSTDGSQAGTGGKKKQFKDYHNLADVPKAKRISNKHFKEKRKEVEKRSRARSPGREEVDRIFGRERRRSRVIEVFPSDNKENNEPPSPVVTDGTPTPHSVDTPTSTLVKSPPPTPSTPREPSTPRDNEDRRGRSISRRSTNMKQGTQSEQPKSRIDSRRAKSLDRKSYESLTLSPDLFNVKKGWLTMLTDGVWKKHWFVLGDKSLRYYQDSTAEDTANVDGSIDLTTCSNVSVIEVQRNYGFKIQLANTDHHLAAMTAGIRRNWIRAIEKSSVPDATKEEDDTQSGKSETIDTSSKKSKDLEDLSVTERSQRRRARIRDRRREGRSRTFDFGEFRPLATQALGMDPTVNDNTPDIQTTEKEDKPTTDVKARSRTFDQDTLLNDVKHKKASESETQKVETKQPVITPRKNAPKLNQNDLWRSIESEWGKIEAVEVEILSADVPPSPITQTATMVKALQSEVDSLKKQMERVNIERTSSVEDTLSEGGRSSVNTDSNIIEDSKLRTKVEHQATVIDKLKQDLSSSHESLRKQSGELRECGMQLDISLSESQLVETQLVNAQNEIQLLKSGRDEQTKDHKRKMETLMTQLESSDAQLKTTETLLLDAQRKIRELERQATLHKDHNKEEALLHDHIKLLQHQAEEQELEMREMQESYEEKCQSEKKLKDRLSQVEEYMSTYEDKLADMQEALKNTDKDLNIISTHRSDAQHDVNKLSADLKTSQAATTRLEDKVAKLIAQNQVDEDCNKTLQEQLHKEKETCKKLRKILEEHDDVVSANEKQLHETKQALDQYSLQLRIAEEGRLASQRTVHDLTVELRKAKDEIQKQKQSTDQVTRDLRARLTTAEKELTDIEEIRLKHKDAPESSFKAKLTELEAEMGGTGQMIAARLSALERPRRDSDSSNASDKETSSQKLHRLEAEIDRKNKEIKSMNEQFKEMEQRENEANEEFTKKLNELRARQDETTKDHELSIAEVRSGMEEVEEKLLCTQDCLRELHKRASGLDRSDPEVTVMLESVLRETLKLASGDISAMSPSLSENRRVTDAESRQQHQRTMSRLRQLTEKLKNSDGRLVSPSASPVSFHRPHDLPISPSTSGIVSEDVAVKLFAKQISTQAMLLAEMAATLRRSQSSPSLVSVGRSQLNRNHNNRQASPSPQLTSAEFSDLRQPNAGGLLQHVDTLAQKLTLEGMLMREISRLRESWSANRGRGAKVGGGVAQSEFSSAIVAHAHISYVLQVYNERISRLSLEARQARHRADSVMRKLRELVHACKTQDLEAVSNLAVQVDTDSITPPYSDVPLWEQQVDYGTLHGAQSTPSPVATEAMYMEQEASFFQHLADDIQCMSADVQSLTKLGTQLILSDESLQKFLHPNEIGEHASAVAREAIVQAEVIYISHRLRRDYDEELRKAKTAVSEQAKHYEALLSKAKNVEDTSAAKLRQVTEEHNAKVRRLMQETEKVENARAELSKNTEQTLTRFKRKHEQELASCNSKHEQESAVLRKEKSSLKNQLDTKTKEYMTDVNELRQRLQQIQVQNRVEGDKLREDYEKKFEKVKDECVRDVEELKKEHHKKLNEVNERHLADKQKLNEELHHVGKIKKKEIEMIERRHEKEIQRIEDEHHDELRQVNRDSKTRAESLKRDFDDVIQQQKSEHKMEIERVRESSEISAKEKIKEKLKLMKEEQEKVLETREKLHSEQLEREKEVWTKELRQQWEEEKSKSEETLPPPSHARSSSLTSESESKEALLARIMSLEGQIDVMREKPGDEQGSHEYQKQLEEIKELCDQSFHCIEETHSKQIEELISAHERELERLREEFSEERAIDKEDTKRAIDVMLKHHEEEISTMRSQLNEKQPKVGSTNGKLSREVEKLKTELETLSEHYSRKCVELANSHEHNQKLDDVVRALERENQRTQARNNELAGSLQAELRSIQPPGVGKEQQAGDLYQLEVMLRVKTSEIDYLKQEVDSINQQLEDCFQEKRQVQKKHQTLFDELTLSRSKEAISRREVVRLKEQLRSTDEEGGGSGGEGRATSSGYDFQKSRSQPDFPPPSNKAGSSSVTSPVTSVKRRSSDRGNRSKI
uniref:protein MLP1 isoform X1 n=1 Tax=Ciona intestinalis TaxID=7719 RepID=UPI000180D02C|nr:protein MLP1 isoform X1 [Ciona intestinalis]|eukprot:XP_002122992.3 protein MLP1 isoform X1 [Ciona intestinalis]